MSSSSASSLLLIFKSRYIASAIWYLTPALRTRSKISLKNQKRSLKIYSGLFVGLRLCLVEHQLVRAMRRVLSRYRRKRETNKTLLQTCIASCYTSFRYCLLNKTSANVILLQSQVLLEWFTANLDVECIEFNPHVSLEIIICNSAKKDINIIFLVFNTACSVLSSGTNVGD